MTTQTLPLNLIPKGVCPRLYVSQYDKGQTWYFDLYAGTEAYTIPSEASVTIQGTKPDKTGFQYACSFSGNRVEATEQQQMTVIAGEVPAEIRIENNNEIIATLNFIIAVEKAALADDTVISETDLPLIEEAIEVLGHADELVQRIEGDVTTSGNNALKAEGFAVGQQNGSDVASGSPYYHNSAKYYKEQAADSASTASTKAGEAAASAQAAAQSAAHLTIDSAMSTTSQNAVQNKVVTGELNSVKETLTNQINVNGAKNFLPKATPENFNGVNYAVDDDGVVTVTGTASPTANKDIDFTVPETGTYFLSGCPANGGSSSYMMWINNKTTGSSTGYEDTGSGVVCNLSKGVTYTCKIRINNAYAISGSLKFYPMIRLASDPDGTYEPYAMTNRQLTTEAQNLLNQVNGVYMYDFTRSWIKHLTITSTLPSGASIKICTQYFDLNLETSSWSLNHSGSAILNTSVSVPLTYSQNGLTFNLNSASRGLNGVIISNTPLTVTVSTTSSPEANVLGAISVENLSTDITNLEANKQPKFTASDDTCNSCRITFTNGHGGVNGSRALVVASGGFIALGFWSGTWQVAWKSLGGQTATNSDNSASGITLTFSEPTSVDVLPIYDADGCVITKIT